MRSSLHEDIQQRIAQKIRNVPVPQIKEQIVDVPVPHFMSELEKWIQLALQESFQHHTEAEVVDVPINANP